MDSTRPHRWFSKGKRSVWIASSAELTLPNLVSLSARQIGSGTNLRRPIPSNFPTPTAGRQRFLLGNFS